MAIIVPCAGKSSRFPGTRPKFLLTMFDGELMVEKAIKPYLENEQIHIIILQEHEKLYDAHSALDKIYGKYDNVHIHVLPEETSGPAETVYRVARKLETDEHIFIKDCDSFFDAPLEKTNHICVADLRDNLNVTKVAAKSFATLNNQEIVTNVVEKSVVSNYICVGGYSFETADMFCETFEELFSEGLKSEIFMSHIIKRMIYNGCVFTSTPVDNYIDVGTYDEFVDFNQSKPTIFCDIDGTVFKNQSHYFSNDYSKTPVPLPSAVNYLLKKQESGSKIIFTTSRPDTYKDITTKALSECGFKDYSILFNMPHAPRMIINDNSKTNPYPTALAMNVPRDDNSYWEKLL